MAAEIIDFPRARDAADQGRTDRYTRKPCVRVYGYEYENRAWLHGWEREDARLTREAQTAAADEAS